MVCLLSRTGHVCIVWYNIYTMIISYCKRMAFSCLTCSSRRGQIGQELHQQVLRVAVLRKTADVQLTILLRVLRWWQVCALLANDIKVNQCPCPIVYTCTVEPHSFLSLSLFSPPQSLYIWNTLNINSITPEMRAPSLNWDTFCSMFYNRNVPLYSY